MKRTEQDRLLNELLAGEELDSFRRTSLERGLAAIRRQQRRRSAVRWSVGVALPLALAVGVFLGAPRGPRSRGTPAAASVRAEVPSPKPETAGVSRITDDELLALFPDRPVALIGKPGVQQLVFLDARPPRGEP